MKKIVLIVLLSFFGFISTANAGLRTPEKDEACEVVDFKNSVTDEQSKVTQNSNPDVKKCVRKKQIGNKLALQMIRPSTDELKELYFCGSNPGIPSGTKFDPKIHIVEDGDNVCWVASIYNEWDTPLNGTIPDTWDSDFVLKDAFLHRDAFDPRNIQKEKLKWKSTGDYSANFFIENLPPGQHYMVLSGTVVSPEVSSFNEENPQ